MLVETETKLEFHEVTERYREMTDREFQELMAGIAANGPWLPIFPMINDCRTPLSSGPSESS